MSHHGKFTAGTIRSRRKRRLAALTASALVGAMLSPLATTPAQAVVAPVGSGFTVTAADLAFILQQIKISERHAATLTPSNPCGTLVAQPGDGIPDADQIPDRLTAYGLRTTDGSCNNLFPGRETFAAADQPFPRLTQPKFRDAEPDIFGRGPTSYANKNTDVTDTQPRLVSNLIVDQTSTNPAAVEAAAHPVRTQGNTGVFACGTPDAPPPPDCIPPGQTLFIPNVTTDVGLSPPFNSIFTFFGQFFDHGVDQTVKSGASVFVPLKDDDPLVLGPDGQLGTADDLDPNLRFMVLTRAQTQPGDDGVLGTPDDTQEATNTDSPWVDQSQTYTSHSAHQVFLREYEMAPVSATSTQLHPVSTGKLLGGLDAGLTYQGSPDGRTGMATWAAVKEQAAAKLGMKLRDIDVVNIPMVAADPYGQYIPGPNGLPQYVTKTGLVEGNLANPVEPPADVLHFDTPFVGDIAHNADPSVKFDSNGDHVPDSLPTPDTDLTPSHDFASQPFGTYDDELMNAHFTAGDGRVNENIALSAIHQIFHSEHDRLVGDIENVLGANPTLLAKYQDTHADSTDPNVRTWTYGDRLFQAARFITEMEYQHLVFEEFARKIQPAIRPFHVYQPDINPAVQAEFAHAVYRFGHSMLDDQVARRTPDAATGKMTDNSLPLLEAFLNPPAFFQGTGGATLTPEQAAGQIFMGSSDQAGNEIDEFVTETLRNNLLGLPLDLPTINMARAREAGVPPLNDVRRQIFAQTNDGQLAPYTSWSDFGQHLKHPASLINFVAAYGTHPTITSKTTYLEKRAAARAIVDPLPTDVPPADAAAFMFSTDSANLVGCADPAANCRDWSSNANGVTTTGLDDVDLWVGGLSEITNLFGGLLGTTFNYVFQTQLEALQEGDRLYYLGRTPGMNLRTQLEGNSFAEMIQRNTDDTNTLKADVFATADCKFQLANLNGTPEGFNQFGSTVIDDPDSECNETALLLRKPDGTIQYRQFNTEDPSGINGQSVYNGTANTDRIFGGNDNDTFWGAEGRDWIEGNGGDDVTLGGDGDDIETDLAGADTQKGGPGDDALDAGIGDDLSLGGDGQDFINGGANDNEQFGGPGSDFIIAGQGADATFGDSGDDWIQGGSGQDLLIGEHSAPFFDDPGQTTPGNDVFVGQVGENDYDAEGGDDIMSQNAAIDRNAGAAGWDWAIHQYDTVGADDDMAINNNLIGIPLPVVVNRDRWQETEANSGSAFDDVIRGDEDVPRLVGGGGFTGCDALDQAAIARIPGLAAIVPPLTGDAADVAALSATGFCPLTGPVWGDGNILLGGAGSDTITGRGADDVIDGDRALNVRIRVNDDLGNQIGSTDLMEHQYLRDAAGNLTGPTLQAAVFAGTVDPGNLVIEREITSNPKPTDVDTAVFRDVRANYTITFNPDNVVVAHTGGSGEDGTDTLTNIEKLQFTDATVDVAVAAPGAPVIGTATAGNRSATVSWTAPATDGNSPITEYQVQVFAGGTTPVDTVTVPAPANTTTVTGLTNGTTYTFRVVAVNAQGSSAPSAESNPVTPVSPTPEVVSTNPAAGATGVAVGTNVVATFDRPVTNVTGTSFRLLNAATGTRVGAAVSLSADGLVATLNPNADLATGTTYTMTLVGTGASGIRSVADGSRLTNFSGQFTTELDTTAPTVTGGNPAAGSANLNPSANVTATFSERVVGVNATTMRLVNNATGNPVAAQVTLSGNGLTATLNPNANLARNTSYTLTITGGATAVRDTAGNALSPATYTRTFRTRP